jgi:hypothetical protein
VVATWPGEVSTGGDGRRPYGLGFRAWGKLSRERGKRR